MWQTIGIAYCAIALMLISDTARALPPAEIGVVAMKSTIRTNTGRDLEIAAGTVVFVLDAVEGENLIIAEVRQQSSTETGDTEILSGWLPETKIVSPQDSIRDLTTIISNDATQASAFLKRGDAHSALRHPADAISDFGRTIALDPGCISAFLGRAEVNRRIGKIADAIEDTSSVLKLAPGLTAARLIRAKALADDNRFGDGIAECSLILEAHPESINARLCRGYLHLLEGDLNRAQLDAEAAGKRPLILQWIQPEEIELGLNFPSRRRTRKPDKGPNWTDFKSWMNLSHVLPSISDQLILFGVLSQQADESNDAVSLLRVALQLRLHPRAELIALYYSARAHLAQWENTEALKNLTNAIQFADSNPHATSTLTMKDVIESAAACCRANLHRDVGDFSKALPEYSEAIRLNANNDAAYLGRGVTRGFMDELDSAMKDFDATLALPDASRKYQALALAGRASVRSYRGDNDGALIELNRAIEIKGNLVDLWDYRALAWARRGEFEKAIADSEEALQQQPGYPHSYRARAIVLYLMGDFQKCLKYYDRALKLNLSEPDLNSALILSQRGFVRFQFGQFAQSLSDFEMAIQRNPKCATAHAGLAMLQSTCSDAKYRDAESAIRHATKACELSDWKRGRYLIALAAALAESGQFEDAVKRLHQAGEVDPKTGADERMRMLTQFSNRKAYRAVSFSMTSPSVSWETIPFAIP